MASLPHSGSGPLGHRHGSGGETAMKLGEDFELSRNPEDYSKTRHYRQRVSDRPMIEDDVVEEVIEEGDIVDVDENWEGNDLCVTLQGDWLFSTFEVKLCPKDKVVQTAYEVEE